MTEIALLCDQSDTDELGIRLTADQMGINLSLLPFFKTTFTFNQKEYAYKTIGKDYTKSLQDVKVVLNRCQSKNRRLYASAIFEYLGKQVMNPQNIEMICQSKVRTLLAFASAGIKIPRTTYASPNVKESVVDGLFQDYTESICKLLEQALKYNMVIKPDAGTHGIGVSLAEGRDDLISILGSVTSGITNPSGVLAQEFIPKWFFDLRILVYKEKGERPICHMDALARCSLQEFRTNTFLGNMVVRARLPINVRKVAETCAGILGEGQDAWVIALDAMPCIPLEMMREEEQLRESFKALEEPFSEVTRVKRMPKKKQQFTEYTKEITRAYTDYMDTEPYRYIESVVNETLRKNSDNIYFHEGSARPELWEQTRVVAGINLAEDLLNCAQSLIDK